MGKTTPAPMYSVDLHCKPEERDLLIAELWERGSRGITELSETQLRAFFESDPEELRRALTPYAARWQVVEPCDWVAMAREKLPPMLAGERFFLVPEWRDDATPAGRFRITVNPGMAFGTGFHETTQLCLEALERHVKPGMRVLDVGTGSGILARAAKLLGAACAVGCDVDPDAVEIARQHAPAFVGSADAVASGWADLLVANISPEVVVALAPEIRRVAGAALLSGFERGEAAAVEAAYPGALYTKGNWCLLEYPGDRHDGDVLGP